MQFRTICTMELELNGLPWRRFALSESYSFYYFEISDTENSKVEH